MLEDEQRHGDNALEAGGMNFPRPIKQAMSALSLLMTRTSYRI
jgi:ubiquinone biosynthesis monooxygenase Coq7